MINSIELKNFRGLEHLKLSDLAQITLLTGRNNAGKSSVLEGIFLFMDHSAAESFGKINNFRGIISSTSPSSLWEPAFYKLDTKKPLIISTVLDGKQCDLRYERDDDFIPVDSNGNIQSAFSQFAAATRSTFTLKFHYNESGYTENGYFSINDTGLFRTVSTSVANNQIKLLSATRFVNPNTRDDISVATWLGQMELKGEKQRIVELLKAIEPDISDIITISNQGQIQLYVKVRNQLLPIRLAGDGLNRLLYYVLAILENPNSILLIDEIDAGFHYSALPNCWRLIAAAAKESGCQIICTTHSYECIKSALEAISAVDMSNNFCLYRIERTAKGNQAHRYNEDLARFAIDAHMEVR